MKASWFFFVSFWLFLLAGCAAPQPVPALAEPSATSSQPSATSSAIPSPTQALPTQTATRTLTPSPTQTLVPSATPHPLAALPYQLVFVSDMEGAADIYKSNIDGTQLERLTQTEGADSFPAVSPDGQFIAFATAEDEISHIFVMDMDGKNPAQLTRDESRNFMPVWSPNGDEIAFVSDRDGDLELFVMTVTGEEVRQLTHNDTEDVFPTWSPDGTWIAFSSSISGNPDIHIVRPDGSELTQISHSANYDGDETTWSPDGAWLLFTSRRVGNKEIYATTLDGSTFGAITQTEENELSGKLSSDGKYLLREWATESSSRFEVSLTSDPSVWHPVLASDVHAWFPTWVPGEEWSESEPPFAFVDPPEGFCVYEQDATYGHTADNPMALGTASRFGGPFASAYASSLLRGPSGEMVASTDRAPDSDLPSLVNTQGAIVAVYTYHIGEGSEGTLYFNTQDHSIPKIPTGFTCDLEHP